LTTHVVGGLFKAVTREVVCPFWGIAVEGVADETIEEWAAGKLEMVKEVKLRGDW
jgi:hypothetical protein